MKKPPIEYPFEVRPLSKEEDGGFAISFPDLPGCLSDGATPEEAIGPRRTAPAMRPLICVNTGRQLRATLKAAAAIRRRPPRTIGDIV